MTIDAHVEMFYNSAWQDITADVDMRSAITVDYGQSDEHGDATPTSCSMRLDNRAAKFSPLDPNSALYGKIGRGTKLRTRIGTKAASLALPGVTGSYASTPDTAALDITGDIDLRLDLQPKTWRPTDPAQHALLMSKWEVTGNQRSWLFMVRTDGLLRLWLSPDGTFASAFAVNSTVAVPDDGARRAVRATVDVNNGAGGNTITFYTAPTLGGAWTQLGAAVVTAGTTSIFASTTPVEIGTADGGTTPFTDTPPIPATVWAAEIRNSIGGTVVANPDFTVRETDDTSFTDASGRVWTVHGGAAIVDPSLRAAGAIGSFKPAWDETTLDALMSVEAAGFLRRLGQGEETLRSAMYRGMTGGNVTTPRAYWPCEDGKQATAIAPGIAGHPPMRINGDVNLAAHSDLDASAPIPTFGTGYVQGAVRAYTVTNFMRCMALVAIPDSITGEPNILYVTTTGSVDRWYLSITSGGDLRIRAIRASDDVEVLNSLIDFNILGKSGLIWIYLTKNGSNVDYQIGFAAVDSTSPGVAGGSVTSTMGSATRVISGGLGGNLGGMAVGHLVVLDTDEFWDINNFAKAWTGETAVARILRLCAEENVPLRLIGSAADSQLVGPQRVATFLDLVEDAAAADGGRFGERRDADGLLYRSRRDLYNQDPAITLNMDDGHIINPFDPPLDDQTVRNDVTITRERGSSARAVQETGSLSIQDPPGGVGRYTTSETLNVHSDGQLASQASWRLHLGVVDEHRIASLEIEMEHHPSLEQAVRNLQAGDLIRISNPPPGLPPGPLDLIALGWTDVIGDEGQTWHVTISCAPGSPWTVAVAGDAELGRADTAGSLLAADATAAATTLKVLTTVGPMWTQDAAEFPFDVRLGGEVVAVSDIVPHLLDRFTRTVANGWGTADSGEAWTTTGGAAADFSTNGTRGLVANNSVNVDRWCLLGNSDRDIDVMASVATDKVATGAPIGARLVARYVDASNYYMARAEFATSGNVVLTIWKVVGGTTTLLAGGFTLGAYAANERFNVRFAIHGSALSAKIWRVGSPELASQLIVTDTSLTAAGQVGMRQRLDSGNTNTLPVTLSWDDLESKAQKFTVTRAQNGISKAQTAGTDVALAQPAIAAL